METRKMRKVTMKLLVNPGCPTSWPMAAMYSANNSRFPRQKRCGLDCVDFSGRQVFASPRSINMDTGGTTPAEYRKTWTAWRTSRA